MTNHSTRSWRKVPLPSALILLLLTALTPATSAYAIVEPLQPTPTLVARQTPLPNIPAASISASFQSLLAVQTNSVSSILQIASALERNLIATRSALSLAQAAVASFAADAGVAAPSPSTTAVDRATALPDVANCETALPRPQALCSGTARTLSIVGFVFGGIGLIALGFLSVVFCRHRLQRKRESMDSRTTSSGASTRAEKQAMPQEAGAGKTALFNRRRRDDEASNDERRYPPATQYTRGQGSQRQRNMSRTDVPAHMSISAPQPGSGPIRFSEDRRPPLQRQTGASGQDGSGETIVFMLGPDDDRTINDYGSENRTSIASRDYLIPGQGRRYSGESNVIPAGTVRVRGNEPDESPIGRTGRDTLSREYNDFMASVVRTPEEMSVGTGRAPEPGPMSPPPLATGKARERQDERMI